MRGWTSRDLPIGGPGLLLPFTPRRPPPDSHGAMSRLAPMVPEWSCRFLLSALPVQLGSRARCWARATRRNSHSRSLCLLSESERERSKEGATCAEPPIPTPAATDTAPLSGPKPRHLPTHDEQTHPSAHPPMHPTCDPPTHLPTRTPHPTTCQLSILGPANPPKWAHPLALVDRKRPLRGPKSAHRSKGTPSPNKFRSGHKNFGPSHVRMQICKCIKKNEKEWTEIISAAFRSNFGPRYSKGFRPTPAGGGRGPSPCPPPRR